MTTEPKRPSAGWLPAILTLAIVASYPTSIVVGAYAVLEPLDSLEIARSLATSLVVAFAIYLASTAAIRDRTARVQWTCIVFLMLCTYRIVVNTGGLAGLPLSPRNPWVALAYIVTTVSTATIVVRPWRRKERELVAIAFIATFLVAVNLSRGLVRWWDESSPQWARAANALTNGPLVEQDTSKAPARDIYYIALDGLGRADTLRDIYGLDIGPLLADLRAQGFYVAASARSNYSQTLLSFSSFMNLDYLDPVAAALGTESNDRQALEFVIQHNAMMRLAARAGYEVIGIGSDYAATERFDEADVCVCRQYGLSLFEQAAISTTPLAAAPLDGLTYGAHRTKILSSLDALATAPQSSRRQFVFAHILAPHPPFTLARDGGFQHPDRPFSITDGTTFEGSTAEYVTGYRDQSAFVLKRVVEIVHALLARPGPRPVIVIHGDHGPGSRLHSDDATQTDLRERMDIFAAYYFPDGTDGLYDAITPVNGARAMATRYLGARLAPLPDISSFSTASQPYEFLRVDLTGKLVPMGR